MGYNAEIGVFSSVGPLNCSEQSLPLGNGEIGANVWGKGSEIFVLLSKTDAWSELGRLLKIGLLRIQFSREIVVEDTVCSLDLRQGKLTINGNGTKLVIFIDAYHPVCRVEAVSEEPITCSVQWENYRNKPFQPKTDDNSNYAMNPLNPAQGPLCDIFESADEVYQDGVGLGQFHHNQDSCYTFTMERQRLHGFSGEDPLMDHAFGGYVRCPQMQPNELSLKSVQPEKKHCIDIFVASGKVKTSEEWYKKMDALSESETVDFEKHREWWHRQWQRSFIRAQGNDWAETITTGYDCQRYLNLCAGRGLYPIKFNGSLFTCQPSPHVEGEANYDYRNWGSQFWIQNTRLIYWNMLYAGDYEEMLPFFHMYMKNLPLSIYRAQQYGENRGAMIPETITFFGAWAHRNFGDGTSARRTGYIENRYIRYHFEGQLEIALMMLCYWEHTGDLKFLEETAYPFVFQVLTFFDSKFEVWDDKYLIYPTSALETWQCCADDTPTIAGMRCLVERVLKMTYIPAELKALCEKMKILIPDLPLEQKEGVFQIAPCRVKIDMERRNVEQPELYAVFPFEIYSVGHKDIEIARESYRNREITESCGWQQHGIQAAWLGLQKEAAQEVMLHFSNKNEECLFPAFWGPNYDWTPDQDNGCSASIALTQMLLQIHDDKIYVFPAWCKQTDVSFRLPIGKGNFLEAQLCNGAVVNLKTDKPETRDIVVCVDK